MCVNERDRDMVSINASQNLPSGRRVHVDESSNLAAASSGGFPTLVFDAAGEAIRLVSRVYLVRTFPQGYETYVLSKKVFLCDYNSTLSREQINQICQDDVSEYPTAGF